MDKRELLARLGMIFSAFPNASLSTLGAEAYVQTLLPYSDKAITEALSNFQQGAVEGQNPQFPPSAPEIAKEVRRIEARIAHRKALAAIPPPDDTLVTPEERARVEPRMRALVSRLTAERAERDEDRGRRRRTKMAETNARFRAREIEAGHVVVTDTGHTYSRSLLETRLMKNAMADKETAPA